MYISRSYFCYMIFSVARISFMVNLKLGFLFYTKKLGFYLNNTKNKLFLVTKGINTLLTLFRRLYGLFKFGHYIELLTVGLGYKVTLYKRRKQICFDLNYSHRIFYKKPGHLLFRVFKKRFLVFGINKMEVVQAAKELRDLRSPNIYKGTGVRYKGEKVVLKVGKTR